MKGLRAPDEEPALLQAFRTKYPDGTWEKQVSGGKRAFKKKKGNQCVFDSLAASQGFICAYCELRIGRPDGEDVDGEVEHFVPKSTPPPPNHALRFTNMLACCKGGTPHNNRRREPVEEHKHCGALKDKVHPDGKILDPRDLPLSTSIWNFSEFGEISPNRGACAAAGIDIALAESTIALLGLNRPLLQEARAAAWSELDKPIAADWTDDEIRDYARSMATQNLVPDTDGRLGPFWSTVFSWCGHAADHIVATYWGTDGATA